MSNIKSFTSFVNESMLVMEGRYDNLVGQIVSATVNLIKKSNNGEETYEGVKVRYEKNLMKGICLPAFYWS